MTPATRRELQLIEASRRLADSRIVVIGSGAAFAVAPLARRTRAPRAAFVIDSGVVDARMERALVSVCDPALTQALRMGSMSSVFFDLLQAGRVDASVLSAAQIDQDGNLNSTYLGPVEAPAKRFPGAGGATAMAAFSSRLIVVVHHERRRFVPKVDYVTCAGPGSSVAGHVREVLVITDLCVLRADTHQPWLRLAALMPGVSPQEVSRNTGFDLDAREPIPRVEGASSEELRLLRDEVDPDALYRS